MGIKSYDYVHCLNHMDDIFNSSLDVHERIEKAFTFLCQITEFEELELYIYNNVLTHGKRLISCNKLGIIESREEPTHFTHPKIIDHLQEQGMYFIESYERETDEQLAELMKAKGHFSYLLYPIKINYNIIGCVIAKKDVRRHMNQVLMHTFVRRLSESISEVIEENYSSFKSFVNDGLYKRFFQSFISPFVILNEDFQLIDLNDAFIDLYDLPMNELIFNDFFSIFKCYNNETLQKSLSLLTINETLNTEVLIVLNQTKKIINLHVFKLKIEDKICYGIVFLDITHTKIQERNLLKMAFYDQSTGLSNRNYYEKICDEISDKTFQTFGVLMFDVDNLKVVNDQYGHEKGDELLVQLSRIINEIFNVEYLRARIGGDEFVVFVMNRPEEYIDQKLSEFLNEIHLMNQELSIPIQLSSGKAFARQEEGKTVEDLIREADQMMYIEKNKKQKAVI